MIMKQYIKLIGITLLLATFLAFVYVFLTAYSNPSKTVLVTINTIGEANSELLLLIITAIFGIMTLIIIVNEVVEEDKKCQDQK